MVIYLLAGLGLGFGMGQLVQFLIGTLPLVNKIARLRYDGFRPETPMPPRPKTVPLPTVRED